MAETHKRPNILFIMTDQQSFNGMRCAGNDDLSTPAMDQLAAEGVRFENTYCPFPLCGPARASQLTGKMPHEINATDNHAVLSDDVVTQTLGHVLSQAGYDCGYAGKWHVGSMPIDGFGFERLAGIQDGRLPDACDEFLRRDRQKPFFLIASFDNPHNICEWGRGMPTPHGPIPEPATLAECPNLPANFTIPAYESQLVRIFQENMPSLKFVQTNSLDDWRRYRFAYYRLIEKADYEIGRILASLRATNHDEDTLVIFTSDHGDMQGAHQLIQKWVLYEESVKVPLIVRLPGGERAGEVDSHLVNNMLDLYVTLCDYAGAEIPPGRHGLSLRPLLEGHPNTPWRETVVVETVFADIPTPPRSRGRMVRSQRYKYTVYEWGRYREQLIDLENDPGEMVNLAVEAKHQDVLYAHRDALSEWCTQTEDKFGHHLTYPDAMFVLPGETSAGKSQQ